MLFLKANVSITKNGQHICTIIVDSLTTIHNGTKTWDWSNSSIDCLIYCQIDDQIAANASFQLDNKFNTKMFGYSYTMFSGYMLFNL